VLVGLELGLGLVVVVVAVVWRRMPLVWVVRLGELPLALGGCCRVWGVGVGMGMGMAVGVWVGVEGAC
jgi:hypothetical protein